MTEGRGQSPLTDDEHAAVTACADAWAAICKVVGDGPTRAADLREVVARIHALQHFVMAQAAARCYPDRYRLAGESLNASASEPSQPEPSAANATAQGRSEASAQTDAP